jgi:hypothetical protein
MTKNEKLKAAFKMVCAYAGSHTSERKKVASVNNGRMSKNGGRPWRCKECGATNKVALKACQCGAARAVKVVVA